MGKQHESLRLADELLIPHQCDFHQVCEQAAAELRRLSALNAELVGKASALLWQLDRIGMTREEEPLMEDLRAALAKATP